MCTCKRAFINFLFFVLFLLCAKKAIERSLIHIKKEKPSIWEKFEVHELDKGFLFSIKEAKNQVKKTIELVEKQESSDRPTKIDLLKHIQKELDRIEKKYKKNSPAMFLLGPIGTASIILKEQRLERELLEAVNKVSAILQTIAQEGVKITDSEQMHVFTNKSENEHKSIELIENGIMHNKKLIEILC